MWPSYRSSEIETVQFIWPNQTNRKRQAVREKAAPNRDWSHLKLTPAGRHSPLPIPVPIPAGA